MISVGETSGSLKWCFLFFWVRKKCGEILGTVVEQPTKSAGSINTHLVGR